MVVNLGLRLAVDDPGQVSALAEIGPVWAAVTGRLAGVSWEMGDGSVGWCVGLGTPYPEGSNQIEQGPVRPHLQPAQPVAGTYSLSATARWDVVLTTSDGRNEMLAPMQISYPFSYRVGEIITIAEG